MAKVMLVSAFTLEIGAGVAFGPESFGTDRGQLVDGVWRMEFICERRYLPSWSSAQLSFGKDVFFVESSILLLVSK